MVRILSLFLIFFSIVFVDMGSKFLMKETLGSEFCYENSPYLVQENSTTRPTYSCFQDNRTQKDFYNRVYADQYHPILGEYLGLKLSYNTGVAFSLPIRGVLLQGITILLIIAIGWQYLRTEYPKKSKLLDLGYIFILAWACSHAYERLYIGHVVDFIAVKYFAIFNFADIVISFWALLLFISYGIFHRK